MNDSIFGQRRVLLDSQAALERSSRAVARSHTVALETEQLGTEVIAELGEQKETLLRAKSRLTETDHELDRTKKVLLIMKSRVLTNKFVLILIIILEVAILGLTVYIKFFSKKK